MPTLSASPSLSLAQFARLAVVLVAPLAALGCGSSTDAAPAATPAAPPAAAAECTSGETRCAGLQVQTCELADGTDGAAGALHWSAATDCADGQTCRDAGGCTPLTADEVQHLASIAALVTESRTTAARAAPVDYDALLGKLRLELLTGDGTPRAYVQTLWDGLLALPQGHQSLAPLKLDSEADLEAAVTMGFDVGAVTVYDACLSPYLDHAVVTIAPTAPGALVLGDEVVAIDGKRGADLQALVMSQPDAADLLPPTTTGRFAFGLRAFLGRDRKGTVLTVRHAGAGAETSVTLGAAGALAKGYSCADPFARDSSVAAAGSLLPDGTGLLYLPGFQERTLSAFASSVGPEFDKVKDAPRLVIDLRGNSGGSLNDALDLVAQLPGAKKADYCEFFDRVPSSEPPSYTSRGRKGVDPAGATSTHRFAYAGKVALLVDGATFSSGEHFVAATRAAAPGTLVIGTKTAGAYGNTSNDVPKPLSGTPTVQVTVNRSQVRTVDGKVLDGVSQVPDIVVEYEPSAIAAAKDPMLMRAVAELTK